MIENDNIADDPTRRLTLDCVAAGIETAEPSTVVAEPVSVDGTELVVDGDRYDLNAYDNILVVGGGKAAATAVSAA